jgi:hypothetical protein
MAWNERDWIYFQDLSHADGPMWMDAVHVKLIYEFLMAARPRSVMELGCFDGFSTSAIVQAKADGAAIEMICVDREIRPSLFKIVRRARTGWQLWQTDSRIALEQSAVTDVLMLDTDHDIETTKSEADIFLRRGWPTVIAHDCGEKGGCPGPQWLFAHLRTSSYWRVFCDDKQRDGMRTDRGLMLATRDMRVTDIARPLFAALRDS